MLNARHVIASLMFCALVPSIASASGFELYGAGARSGSMGLTGVASDGGYTAIFANPAAMVNEGGTAGAGFFTTVDGLAIRLADRPSGYDIPDFGANSPAIPTSFRLRERADTVGVPALNALFAGGTSDLGIERLRIGLLALIPVSGDAAQTTYLNDEREQYFSNALHFDVLGERNHHPIVAAALAFRITDGVAIGAGASFMPGAQGTNRVFIDNVADQSEIDVTVDVANRARWRPVAGLLFTPVPQLDIALSFRDEQLMTIEQTNEVQARGLQGEEGFPFVQDLFIVTNYSPRQVLAGVAWSDFGHLLTADIAYTVWSTFPSSEGDSAGFDDTVSPRLGWEADVGGGHHHLRAGIAYEPTPVPEQTGRTNYVDNDRVVVTAGTGHSLDVLALGAIELSWYAQVHLLAPRTDEKAALTRYPSCEDGVTTLCDEVPDGATDPLTGAAWVGAEGLQTGNPGFPAYSSGGWLFAAGLEARWQF